MARFTVKELITELKDLDDKELDRVTAALEALTEAETQFSRQTGTASQKLRALNKEESEYVNLLKVRHEAQKEGIELTQAEIDRLRELETNGAAARVAAKKLSAELEKTGKVLVENFAGGLDDAFSSLSGFTSAVFDLVHQFDAAATELGKTSGYVESFNKDIIDSAKATSGFSVSMAEAGQAIGGLSTNMTLFNALGKAQRHEIETTTLALQRLGVDSASTGQALDVLTRGMGLSSSAANQAARSFDRLAQDVGLPTSEVIDGFNQISGQLARFGRRGTKVFADLTKQARSMGVTVQEAFDLAEAFDTFEGAAELAGKLNAQIGLQLNSVQIMNASHEDRIKILQREFRMRGKNFDDMSRRQKQAIAEVMGVDVDMASRIFGDPAKLMRYRREQKKLEDRAKAVTSIQEDLKNVLQEVMLALSPLITGLRAITKFISSHTVPKWIFLTGILLKFSGTLPLVTSGIKALAARSTVLTSIGDKLASTFSAVGKGGDKMAAGTKDAGKAAQTSLGQLAGMALVITAIGAAVWMAASGVANLVLAFKGMGAEAIAAVGGIVAFGFAMAMIIPQLVALGTFGWPGVAAVIALGVAMVGMGFAVKLVVDSMGGLITSLSFLTLAKGAEIAGGLAMIGLAFIGFAKAAVFAGVGSVFIYKLSGAILALGAALLLTSTPLERIGKLLVSGLQSVGNIARGIGDIFIGIQGISAAHIIAVSGAMLKLRTSLVSLLDVKQDQLRALTGFLVTLRAVGNEMGAFAAAADSLKSVEKLITVDASIEQLEGKAKLLSSLAQAGIAMQGLKGPVASLGQAPTAVTAIAGMNAASSQRLAAGARPAAGPAPASSSGRAASQTIPIVFQLGDTVIREYILKVTGDANDLLRIQ
jgi:hypothetical protein